jgi:hypothetical protein
MNSPEASGSGPVAPCGINCSLCLGFLREKNTCGGCRSGACKMSKHISVCRIKHCEHLRETTSGFCYECIKFPCTRIKNLDKRYRSRYHVHIMENFEAIKTKGLDAFIRMDSIRWQCPTCGGTICMHKGYCLKCGKGKA